MEVVVIGGSAGSFKIASELLAVMKKNKDKTVIICLHRWKEKSTDFVKTLTIKSPFPSVEISDKMPLLPGRLYVAPSNYHVYISEEKQFILTNEEEFSYSRPSIDICFMSAAKAFGKSCTGILLSGANNDGAIGLAEIIKAEGRAIVQAPAECEISVMPEAAIEFNPGITVLPIAEIKKIL